MVDIRIVTAYTDFATMSKINLATNPTILVMNSNACFPSPNTVLPAFPSDTNAPVTATGAAAAAPAGNNGNRNAIIQVLKPDVNILDKQNTSGIRNNFAANQKCRVCRGH
jgi:hypothetical protein